MILCGWIGGILLDLVVFASLTNVLRCIYLCSKVEPGIIPKVRSNSIDYQRPYKVTYRDQNEASQKGVIPVDSYFGLKHFKIVSADQPITE